LGRNCKLIWLAAILMGSSLWVSGAAAKAAVTETGQVRAPAPSGQISRAAAGAGAQAREPAARLLDTGGPEKIFWTLAEAGRQTWPVRLEAHAPTQIIPPGGRQKVARRRGGWRATGARGPTVLAPAVPLSSRRLAPTP
jgi:hypothetical protein